MKILNIDYTVDGRKFTGYLADGSNGHTTAGVLVAHEGGGMTNHPQERARMLAELGYIAFAMDTFGEVITSTAQAMATIGGLTNDLPTLRKRARTALDLLKSQPNVDPARTAAIGFCFGGTTVLELARSGADVGCVVGFHSGLATSAPQAVRREPAALDVHLPRMRDTPPAQSPLPRLMLPKEESQPNAIAARPAAPARRLLAATPATGIRIRPTPSGGRTKRRRCTRLTASSCKAGSSSKIARRPRCSSATAPATTPATCG